MRDILIIGIACAAAILLGAWLYFSPAAAPAPAPGAATFRVLDQGATSGSITERKNYRIKNQDELEELWKMLHGTGAPANIDFDTSEVIAVFDGTHATGGYSISIESITDNPGGARAVAIVHAEPGTSCLTSDGITSPFQIVVLPKSASPLTHEDRTTVNECP